MTMVEGCGLELWLCSRVMGVVEGCGVGPWCRIMARAMGSTMAYGYGYGHGLELWLWAMA